MTDLADVKHLRVAFQTAQRTMYAVNDISFCLKPGQTTALLGESGCGKSLTALALMRLLPHYGVYGQDSVIELDGQDILLLPESLMRQLRGKRLAIVFQEPMTALNPVLRIGEQLAEAVQQHQVLPAASKQQHLVALLHKVELMSERYLYQYPHQLSGGEKQRVLIAMALANNPDILIADEPTTALDVTIQAQILTLLKKLQQEHAMSMLLITHDLAVVKAMADRVCVMYAGQLVEDALVADFFASVKHPYAQQLLAAIPDFAKRQHRLQTIAGRVPSLDELAQGCYFHPRCAHAFAPCGTNMPRLQTLDNRAVRCHLYPSHTHLPSLDTSKQRWPARPIEQTGELLLTVEQLAVYFNTTTTPFNRQATSIKAVDGLSFNLYQGKTLALVGESGCGKTTVSRALLRLHQVSGGDIRYRGQSVTRLKGGALRAYRKQVQLIFQDPYSSMNPRMTIAEIIAEGMLNDDRASIARKQQQLLDYVNLPKTSLTRYPHQFSGGQRQRICIARALATNPRILICDEPTSALDVSVQAQILNLLKELQLELGIAYLFITHNMAVVSYLADDVLVMRYGQLVETGSCEQILTAPQHPYTRQLLASVLPI